MLYIPANGVLGFGDVTKYQYSSVSVSSSWYRASPSRIQQNREAQRAENSDLRLLHKVLAAPHTFVQRNHRILGASQSSIHFWFAASRWVNHVADVGERLRDFLILTAHRENVEGSKASGTVIYVNVIAVSGNIGIEARCTLNIR